MKKKYLRCGFMVILIMCAFALLVSCSVGGGEEEETTTTTEEGGGEEGGGTPLGPGTGEPVYITITVNPETIQVKGTGGIESAAVTASVKDETGEPYNDSPDNIRFDILSGPGGDEVLDSGDGSPSTSETTTTSEGSVSVALNSGFLPGTVRVEVTVLKDGSGNALATPITAISTQIGIEGGDPFSIILYTAPDVQDNGDGSIGWTISAMVQDQYGNPVANGTGIYFGLVDSPPLGYKSWNTDGVTNGTSTFVSPATNFVTDGVEPFDTLIILEGEDEGGYIINTPANGSVTLSHTLNGSEAALDFVAGDIYFGQVCGIVQTGNLELDSACTPSGGLSIKGVAHSRLTWGQPAIFKPFYLYAETEGKDLGATLAGYYPAVEPLTIDVTIVPDEVTGGAPPPTITVYAHLYDGASPPHDVPDTTLLFTSSSPNDVGFGGLGAGFESTTAVTGFNGRASDTSVETRPVASGTNVSITVSYGPIYGSAQLSLTP